MISRIEPDESELDDIIEKVGYSYNSKKDLFFSNPNAWQREMGYCRLYDEVAAPFGIIVDSEPIYFSYAGKRWLIEFWKGQYDLTTGCEIGLYTTEEPDLDILGIFSGTFYNCVSLEDELFMSYTLKKNGETMFTREDKQWWLTSFKLGEFTEPSELTMDIYITLKDKTMLKEFITGLEAAGYSEDEYSIDELSVAIKFDKPHTQQPITRTYLTDMIIQQKNKLLCDKYQSITKEYVTSLAKINAIKDQAPELYGEVLNIGKTKQFFDIYNQIKKYF
ncbi:MAG TPA: DUF4474 domain-containing protein [Ruminiclostridium sp.]